MAVKDYLMSNSEKYRQAIKNTGPIDNASLYRQVKNSRKDATPVMYCVDDPYWNDLMLKTWKRS